jgi:hypothetical protein
LFVAAAAIEASLLQVCCIKKYSLKPERRWVRDSLAHVASGLVISISYQRGMLAPSDVRRHDFQ